MPGNLKVKPTDAIYLWKLWLANPDYQAVKANRKRTSIIGSLKTLCVGTLVSIFYRKNLFDSGGTPTLVNTNFMNELQDIAPTEYDFELFTLFAMRHSRYKVLRSSVKYEKRKYGQSHWQTSFASELELLKKLLSQTKRFKRLRERKK
jgi:hypothetical protein